MLKNSKKYSKLKNEWKNWKEVVDILIFGSSVRGKSVPADIDVCIVFRNAVEINILKKVQNILGEKYHVSALTVDNFFTKPHTLAATMLLEGKSILSGRKFSDTFSARPWILYSYDISKEPAATKVRFVYLLRGRNKSQGIVESWKGQFIAHNVFIIPLEKDSDAQEVFNTWKIKHSRRRIMMIG